MNNPLNQTVTFAVLGVIVLAVIIFAVMKLRAPARQEQTTGSEQTMQQYQKTGKFYNPPPGINPAAR